MPREIFVHADLCGKVHFVGRLWIHGGSAGESASFEYSRTWRNSPIRFSLEPALALDQGAFHTERGKSLFGSIGDSAPDRWGRVLMERREALNARAEGRSPRLLLDADYLLMVSDVARQGALRFSTQKEGPFLAPAATGNIPPLVGLARLLAASERILSRRELDQDIQDLVSPGSSLGGARPKASVIGSNGELLMAKFPSPHDDWDVELWEYLSLNMAKRAGITIPDVRLEKVAGKNVLLLKRFDRQGAVRIPFLSAMSMLGYADGDHGSYLELAEVMTEHGAQATLDRKELWLRMVFNILTSNVDDHLRNHGFLYEGPSGWRLSPLYDLEPTPAHKKPRVLHTRIDLYDGTASLDLAYSVAGECGLSLTEARAVAAEVAQATRTWDKAAAALGAGKDEIERMRSAFDHEDLQLALKGGGNIPLRGHDARL
jgi:serine/threonine-protein kinase HipA